MKQAHTGGKGNGKKGNSKGNFTKQQMLRRKYRMTILRNAIISVLTVLLVVVGTAYLYLHLVFKGPSETFSDQLASTLMETSAMKIVPQIFFSDEEIEAILAKNKVVAPEEETDLSLITIQAREETPEGEQTAEDDDGIEIVPVTGPTYKGYMMIVSDPSRVSVGTCADSFNNAPGLQLDKIAQRYNAVGAINGGAFSDAGGMGNGGTPLGLVISNGQCLMDGMSVEGQDVLIGFDENDRLIIGRMSKAQAKERKIRDAVTFGPALIINGESAAVMGAGSGLNPRTAIGQRADGAVLMLVIDGRQISSLGASYQDLIEIMLEFGAVNAANLDGGSSSLMYYEGEFLNNGFVLVGSRQMPTAFVVK